jgi:hypothetical protein
MSQHGKQHANQTILLALACGATPEAAARQAQVSERTVHRRLVDPKFRKQLEQLRSDILQRTSSSLTAAGSESVRTLLELQKASVPPATRLGAAKAVLEIGMKLREMTELKDRIAALEQRLGTTPATEMPANEAESNPDLNVNSTE